MSKADGTLDQDGFGIGLMAALHLRGLESLDESQPTVVHEAFLEAFKVVKKDLERNVRFIVNLHPSHRTSPDVFNILSKWQGPWATKELDGEVWKFTIDSPTAEQQLSLLAGDRQMYMEAADAFLKRYRGY